MHACAQEFAFACICLKMFVAPAYVPVPCWQSSGAPPMPACLHALAPPAHVLASPCSHFFPPPHTCPCLPFCVLAMTGSKYTKRGSVSQRHDSTHRCPCLPYCVQAMTDSGYTKRGSVSQRPGSGVPGLPGRQCSLPRWVRGACGFVDMWMLRHVGAWGSLAVSKGAFSAFKFMLDQAVRHKLWVGLGSLCQDAPCEWQAHASGSQVFLWSGLGLYGARSCLACLEQGWRKVMQVWCKDGARACA